MPLTGAVASWETVTGTVLPPLPTVTAGAAVSGLRCAVTLAGYRGQVADADEGWRTERLDVEALTVDHAAELAPLLNDLALHEFTGGAPLDPGALAVRYALLASRRSPDGSQVWGNWVIREHGSGAAAGTLQATMPAAGPGAGPAEVAWVVARRYQGQGYAKEGARSLVARLCRAGWTVIAHIHPGHLASQGVARAAGLSPTGDTHDGEVRWISSRRDPVADQ
jgi:RimJ/RimL family protein N-acetyltransferase